MIVEPGHDVVSVNLSSNLHLLIARRLISLEPLKKLVEKIVRVAYKFTVECFVGPTRHVFSDCNDLSVRALMTFRAMATLHVDTAQSCS